MFRNWADPYCEYFTVNGIRVLALDKVVEMAESSVSRKISLSDMNSRYGKPDRIFESPSGMKTCLYGSFAADIQGDMVRKVIYFENSPRP